MSESVREEVEAPVIDGLDGWLREIDERGYTVVPDFLDASAVQSIRDAFNNEVPITPLPLDKAGEGKTIRGHNLLAKTRAVDFVFLDPCVRALVEGVIGKESRINITTLFNLLPGEKQQPRHQDDGLWPIPRPHPPFLLNIVIAIDDFDEDNGATHVVPYSHAWHDRKVDQSEPTTQVTMKSGSLLAWSGALWHGGGANTTSDRERLGLFLSHVVAYLAPQETQLISVPRDIVRTLDPTLQRLIGYRKFSRIGGEIDFRDPIDVLADGEVVHPTAKVGHSGFGRV